MEGNAMLTQAKLGDSLMKNLMEKREEKGEISLEDVGTIFQQVASDFQSLGGDTEEILHREIIKMAEGIQLAKTEIAAISSKQQGENSQSISGATIHLDAVVKSTEKASNEIMDAADAIQAAAAGIGGEAEQKIMDASMKIYEACNFQDLTGQQINKVIELISFLEDRLQKISAIFTNGNLPEASDNHSEVKNVSEINPANIDTESLKNGPQLEQPSQDDIDALFDSVAPDNTAG